MIVFIIIVSLTIVAGLFLYLSFNKNKTTWKNHTVHPKRAILRQTQPITKRNIPTTNVNIPFQKRTNRLFN